MKLIDDDKELIVEMAKIEDVTLSGDWTPSELNVYEQNYPYDYNACHRVLRKLNWDQKMNYEDILSQIRFAEDGCRAFQQCIDASPKEICNAIILAVKER